MKAKISLRMGVCFLIALPLLTGCGTTFFTRSAGLTFRSEPQGASVYRDGNYIGKTPFTVEWLVDPAGSGVNTPAREVDFGNFTARLEGFKVANKRVNLNWPPMYPQVGRETSMGHIVIDYQVNFFMERDYSVVTAPEPATRPTQQQQQQQQQTVVLPDYGSKKGADKGKILLTSTPQNVEISVDGIFVGNSPCTIPLTEGIHIVEAKLTGYKSFRREIRVIESSEVNLLISLEKE